MCIVFTLDNLGDALKKNSSETFKLFFPVLILFGIGIFSVQLPSFDEERAVAVFLYQMTFAIIILKLMLLNMSNRPFTPLNIQYFYPLVPILAYRIFEVTAETEKMLTRGCMMTAFLEFYFTVYTISS